MVKMWRLLIRTRDRQRRKGSATKVVLPSRNEGLSISSVVQHDSVLLVQVPFSLSPRYYASASWWTETLKPANLARIPIHIISNVLKMTPANKSNSHSHYSMAALELKATKYYT